MSKTATAALSTEAYSPIVKCNSNQTGRLGPHRLVTPAITPITMREEVHIISPSPANGTMPHGLPTPANDVPSKGFTAVNGESRTMSFRPDASARPTVITNMMNGDSNRQSVPDTASTTSSYTPHNWRPDERGTDHPRSQPQSETPNKRRRADSPGGRPHDGNRVERSSTSGTVSPKRRMTAGGPESVVSPERPSESRSYSNERQGLPPPTTGPYAREPSPVFRADRVESPPQPPPEVDASLKASLERSLNTDRQDRNVARSVSPPEPESPESPDRQGSNEPDQDQAGDSDPKKRKRNFSNRTKTGCHTCRARKKKCDEGKPTCENCKRGSFECGGYGPKPPGKISAMRNVPIQAARQFDGRPAAYHDPPPPHLYQHGPSRPPGPWDPVRHEMYPPPPHPYGPPPHMDHRPPPGRDSWGPRPPWGAEPAPSYLSDRLPPVDYSSVPPPHAYQGRYPDFRPPPDGWTAQHGPPRLPPGPPPMPFSSRESVHSSTSGNSGGGSHSLMLPPNGPATGTKAKMLTGQPYNHYLEPDIQLAKKMCSRAVEAYNQACLPSSTVSSDEQTRHFKSIINPSFRTSFDSVAARYDGPVGAVGSRTIVQCPFSCEFGFNISLGDDTVIEAGCLMQDCAPVVIGHRVIVGPRVTFCTLTASVDANVRSGTQGAFVTGAIRVEDDVYIGANVTVMPFRTIGKGAQVGAGSVVTRDVKPYTVVAGNPAKPVRKRRIESGPNVDRHDDSIQEENDKMLEWMKKRFANPHVRPSTEGGMR